MATTDSIQPLIAAFAFGILFNTASAGFILYFKGHGSAIFRDGLRLALIIFLATSGLWALVGFISTLLAPTASSQCQIAVIISSLFDQVARTAIQQSLVWAVAKEGTPSLLGKIQQFQVLARFIVGMVFVGETRPQFNSTCVPASNLTAIAIVVIALDAVMLVTLAIRALSSDNSNQNAGKRKAILFTITALAVWMGTSVTLLLGLRTIDLLLRTTIPAIGLFILTALVTVFVGVLGAGKESRQQPPVSPTPQNYNRNRDISTADSDDYPPSRYAELKGPETTVTTFSNENVKRDENGLPLISRPITGVTGLGGVPVQGQLFPPMRPARDDDAPRMPPQRLIDVKTQNNKSKKGAGKLAISNPIPAETPDMQDALNKIPTIDLATAWKNEKERRAVTTQVRNSTSQARDATTLIASRPAPRPPQNAFPAEKDDKEQNVETNSFPSISGKDGYPIDRLQSQQVPQSDEALSVGGNASSSSGVQLSPGNEEAVRRRSPRQTTSSARTPSFKPVTPGQPVRIPIPRPRPPPVEEEKAPEPVKTPLQRRPTTGLPSNPRARSTRRKSDEEKDGKEEGKERQETVMFINSIIYDDPNFVNDIIQGASKTPGGPPNSGDSAASRGSILDRPRPIRRMSDTDRQVFPSEPMHRRSKSGGSVVSRKSILQSVPGSPAQLPPLPPPPKSAGSIQRPHPNDTKSMTFDEKMTLLYPPSTTTSPAEAPSDMKRKSSVPSLPPLPYAFRNGKTSPKKEVNMDAGIGLDEEKTTSDRSSLRTQSILGEDDGANQRYTQNSVRDGTKRSSSPVLPAVKFSRASGASDAKTQFSTNWGSVHSPVAPIDVQKARLCPRELYIKNQGRAPVPSAISGTGEEVMTVMLDTEPEDSADNRQSFFLEDDDDKSLPDAPKAEEPRQSQWHRRVGDECLSFSERKDKVRSRMMPPPPPLLLNGIGKKKAIMIPAPEPSPLESPEAAIQTIQAQLKKFEEPNRDSVESTGRRIALLENLEQEMGMQENMWHTLHNNINRESVSTTQDSPVKESGPEFTSVDSVSQPTSTRSSIAERRASRRARMSSLSSSLSREQSTERPSSQNSDSRKSTVWQVRLAEAHSQYMEHSSNLLQRRSNLNFLSVSQQASADLGSPTPPETDESESEADSILRNLARQPVQPVTEVNYLWSLSPQQPESPSSQLWMSPLHKEDKPFPELPGLSVRPALRKTSEPLKIESTSLWQKPMESTSTRTAGLWTKAVHKERPVPKKIMVRPTTQRPPRRTKRITALPDIIESPKPLPEKRGTLGIFQFPWGQKSDNATIPVVPQMQPRMFMAMPGTMASGGPRSMPGTMSSGGGRLSAALEARAEEVQESEETGYSSSFFDDYEEEDSGDNVDDDDYYDSGDDFDETTLWEIASLLKTDSGLPGRDSLTLPTMGGASLDEYESEMSPDFERMYGEEYSGMDAVPDDSVPITQALATTSHAQDLWVPKAPAVSNRQLGLPQPDRDTWASYMSDDSDIIRPQSRLVELAPIESENLWGSAPVSSSKAAPAQTLQPTATTWTPATEKAVPSYGLPQPTQSIWASYLPAESEPKRNPPRFEDAAPLESNELWSPAQDMDFQMDDYLWAPVFKVKNVTQPRSMSPPAAPVSPVTPLPTLAPVTYVPPEAPKAKQVATKAVDAMWTPSASSTSPVYGLPQPIASVWASYIPSGEGMLRAQSRKEEIQPIQSTKLWSPKTEAVAKTMLWSKPSVQKKQTFGLPQPDTAVWTSYVPSNIGMTRTQSRREEIQPIESTKLWSLKTENAPKTMMWSKPQVQEQKTFGLAQPDSAVWQSYMPQQTEMTRPQPRFEEMPSIESYNLWMPQEVEFASSTGLLWSESAESAALLSLIPASASAPVAKPVATPVAQPEAQQATASLWDQPAAIVASSETEGLFDASAPRADYRRTSKLPAAISMTTKPRTSHEPLPQLTSQHLWVAPRSEERSNGEGLWALSSGFASLSTPASTAGLFKLDAERTTYRTTDAEPAALHMTRKPRQITTAVPTIESSRMWSPSATTVVELDWITISTIRPRSPSLASVASTNSTVSSPTTDTSSVRTTATKASTAPSVAESAQSGFSLRGWFGRKKKSESDIPKLPEQPELPKVPELPEEFVVKNLDEELRLDEPLPIKNLDEEFVVNNLDVVAPTKPVYIPTRQQYRQPVAFRGNWDAALSEAIAASYPNTRFALVHASESQWDEALQAAIKASGPTPRVKRSNSSPKQWSQALAQAIAASYPDKRFSRGQIPYSQWEDELREAIARSKRSAAFDASKRHPVFMASSLLTNAQDVHPAAVGYTYDSACRHPVFFGSATSTTSETAHPAMPKLVQQKQQQKEQKTQSRPFTPPRPLSRGGKVAALAGRISFLNESSRPASIVPMPRMSVMAKPAAEAAPQVLSLPQQSMLWSKPAQPAAQASQGLMWTPSVRRTATPSVPSLQMSMADRPQRKASKPSAAIDVSADFGAQGMWQRVPQTESPSRNWVEGAHKHTSKIQLRY
ncbi:hypothetical protein PG993_005361 [Apiospora rasikravindrae]|uniref:Uncharacterized protein n=1 Tax=Apiospora rasikravindrae TaxID=990691 RepID=A0ABR1TG13_9PEZI